MDVSEIVHELVSDGWQAHTDIAPSGLLDAVLDLMEKGTGSPGGWTGKRSASPAPWRGDAGQWSVDVHRGVRQIHEDLMWVVHNVSRPSVIGENGSTQALTKTLLLRIADLVPLAPKHYGEAATKQLEGWRMKALMILGEVRRDARVPLSCPVCIKPGNLRQKPSDYNPLGGNVYCPNPECDAVWSPEELGFLGRLSEQLAS